MMPFGLNAQLLGLVVHDHVHNFTGVRGRRGEGESKALGGRQLTCCPAGLRMTPKIDKSADGSATTTKNTHLIVSLGLTRGPFRNPFRLFDQPLNEDARFGIAEPTRQSVVFQDVVQEWLRQHRHLITGPQPATHWFVVGEPIARSCIERLKAALRD
jgi:hypothetical protein